MVGNTSDLNITAQAGVDRLPQWPRLLVTGATGVSSVVSCFDFSPFVLATLSSGLLALSVGKKSGRYRPLCKGTSRRRTLTDLSNWMEQTVDGHDS